MLIYQTRWEQGKKADLVGVPDRGVRHGETWRLLIHHGELLREDGVQEKEIEESE